VVCCVLWRGRVCLFFFRRCGGGVVPSGAAPLLSSLGWVGCLCWNAWCFGSVRRSKAVWWRGWVSVAGRDSVGLGGRVWLCRSLPVSFL
jgi:hypothetical protein